MSEDLLASCVGKHKFAKVRDVLPIAKKTRADFYKCRHCGFYHIGNEIKKTRKGKRK